MPSEKTGYPNLKAPLPRRFWSRFSRGRSTTNRSILHLVVTNIVSLTVPAPCTDRDLVEAIASRGFHSDPYRVAA